jgi:hypothetical protein
MKNEPGNKDKGIKRRKREGPVNRDYIWNRNELENEGNKN